MQSFAWGSGDPLGYFVAEPTTADVAVHLLVGTFVSGKFISIFAFLFGLGAALQFRSLRALAPSGASPRTVSRDAPAQQLSPAQAQGIYRRRLRFLLGVGCAHGFLLYFGDILTAYALCGFILVHYLKQPSARLVRAAVHWWIAALALTVLATVLSELARRVAPGSADPAKIPAESLRALATYTTGSFFEQPGQRAADFTVVLQSLLLLSAPQLVGLFLLGLLAGRLGWVARPGRHRRVWEAATYVGLAALPIAAFGAWLNFDAMLREPGDPGTIGYALQFIGSALACFYVAMLVRLRGQPVVAALIRWMAPAGRMPLTNYLAQSVAMGFLLSGWGLGLGADLGKAQLALLALAIVALQWPTSRWIVRRYGTGPMEAWWARATYPPGLRHGPPSDSDPSSR